MSQAGVPRSMLLSRQLHDGVWPEERGRGRGRGGGVYPFVTKTMTEKAEGEVSNASIKIQDVSQREAVP